MARVVLVWLLLMFLAITNGALRVAVLIPLLGESAGHVVSTMLLCCLIIAVALVFSAWMGIRSHRHAALAGVVWLILTLAFEFLAGHYLFGAPWSKLLADYDLSAGRVWVLVPVTCATAPALALLAAKS